MMTMTTPYEYVPRHLSNRLDEFLAQFPVVLLQGARQVGKSTLLKNHLSAWQHLDLEQASVTALVARDPELYLRDHPERVWFDEVQRVPELFPALRVAIDRDRRPGRYVISGSANPILLKRVSESLAGRTGILDLSPYSAAEAARRNPPSFLQHFLAAHDARDLFERMNAASRADEAEFRRHWLIGGYPEVHQLTDATQRQRWFEAYTRLISERDLRELAAGLHPTAFHRLLRMLAARHGQALNLSALANEMGIATNTLKSYLDLLEGAFLWRRLPPYHRNLGKRLVKTPKAYLADSGLLHALLAQTRLEEVEVSPLHGASWEGWIITQLEAQTRLLDTPLQLYYWRTNAGAEVDLVLENGTRLFAIEIKATSQIQSADLRGLKQFLEDYSDATRFGVIVYRGEHVARVHEQIVAVPVGMAV